MNEYLFLIPVSLALGLLGLAAFLWSLRHEQYDDLDGAAERVLFADDWPITERSTHAVPNPSPAEQDVGAGEEADNVTGRVADRKSPADSKPCSTIGRHQTSSGPSGK